MVSWDVEIVGARAGGLTIQQENTLLETTLIAAESIGRYFDAPDVTISVSVDVSPNNGLGDSALASGGPQVLFSIDQTPEGQTIFRGVPEQKLIDGDDTNDNEVDLVVSVNSTEYTSTFFAEPTPGAIDVPFDRFDLLTVITHELLHGLGLISFAELPQELANATQVTVFGSLIEVSGSLAFLTSDNVVELLGEDLLLEEPSHFGPGFAGTAFVNPELLSAFGTEGVREYINPIHIAIFEDMGLPIKRATGEADTLYGFEALDPAFFDLLSGPIPTVYFGADTLDGRGGDDTLFGLSGDDTLNGQQGDDTLIGGAGDDMLIGGDGEDTADYSQETGGAGVSINLGSGVIIDSFGDEDVLQSIERVVATSRADQLFGDDGRDAFTGGAGADIITGGGSFDTVDYSAETGGNAVVVNFQTDIATDTFGQSDTLRSIENVVGSAANDVIFGDGAQNDFDGRDGADQLNAQAGNDTVRGGGGNDTIVGGIGDDRLFGDDGDDVIGGRVDNDRIEGGAGDDRLFGQLGDDVLVGGGGDDAINGGVGADRINGGDGDDDILARDGNDVVDGGDDDDRINGGTGQDRITGGAGDDTLIGGADGDTFVFDTANFGDDQLVRYAIGVDQIEIAASLATNIDALAISQNGEDAVIAFGGGSLTLLDRDANDLSGADFIFA